MFEIKSKVKLEVWLTTEDLIKVSKFLEKLEKGKEIVAQSSEEPPTNPGGVGNTGNK